MIQSLNKTTGQTPVELKIQVKMSDGSKITEVFARGDNSASIEWDRYQNALRVAEQAIYAAFFPDQVFKANADNSRRQPGQAGEPASPVSGSIAGSHCDYCRHGDEGPIRDPEAH